MAHGSIWTDLMGVCFEQGWLDAGGIRTRFLHAGDQARRRHFLPGRA